MGWPNLQVEKKVKELWQHLKDCRPHLRRISEEEIITGLDVLLVQALISYTLSKMAAEDLEAIELQEQLEERLES